MNARPVLGLVAGLLLMAGPGEAATDLFRADFGNAPLGGPPLARIGSFSPSPLATVEGPSPGFATPCLRIDGSSPDAAALQWIPVLTPSTGDFSIRWQMLFTEALLAGDAVFVAGVFGLPGQPSRSVPTVAFGPGGQMEFNSVPIGDTYGAGIVYRFRMDYSLSAGRATLFINDVAVASGLSEYRTGHAFRMVYLSVAGSYQGDVYLDNLSVTHLQPWVPHLRTNFDAYPLGDLATGDLPGYPVEDDLFAILRDPAPTDTLAVETSSPWGRHLTLQNGDPAGTPLQVEFRPNRVPLEDGIYRLLFDLQRSTTAGQVDVALLGETFPVFQLRFSGLNLGVTSNQTILPIDFPIPANVIHRFDARLDTVADTYSLTINGIPVFSNWPTARMDLPTAVSIATDTNATGLYFFDEIALERRGRQGLYIVRDQGDAPGLIKFNSLSQQLDDEEVFEEDDQIFYGRGTFGPDGNLWILNNHSNRVGVWIYDPATLHPLDFWTDPRFGASLLGIATRRDGHVLILARDGPADPSRLELFDASREWLRTLAAPPLDAQKMVITRDGSRLLMESLARIFICDAETGETLSPLGVVDVWDLPAIRAIAAGTDNWLYLIDDAGIVSVVDYARNQAIAVLYDPEYGRWDTLAVLPNGNPVFVSSLPALAIEHDRFTFDLSASREYDSDGLMFTTARNAIAAPALRMDDMDWDPATAMGLRVDGEAGRFYDIHAATNLPDSVWLPAFTNLFASNACPRLVATNPPASRLRFYRLQESGLP